jgi:uncharacterized membrane protein YqaE (UPF0057 family)
MNRNWIFLVFALLGLASCSVEKRVYRPGYHIEWNHYTEQDASRDVEQDAMQDASRDVEQDAMQDASRDLSENLEIDVSQDAMQDASRDLSENLEIDVSQDAMQDASRDHSENLEIDVSQDAMQDASRDHSENLSKNLETAVSKGTGGQTIDSDLELVLYIALALFLPALVIFLMEGFSKNFWIALLLMVIAFSLGLPLFLQLMIEAIATVLAIGILLHYM